MARFLLKQSMGLFAIQIPFLFYAKGTPVAVLIEKVPLLGTSPLSLHICDLKPEGISLVPYADSTLWAACPKALVAGYRETMEWVFAQCIPSFAILTEITPGGTRTYPPDPCRSWMLYAQRLG
jgi:hypothetical protein